MRTFILGAAILSTITLHAQTLTFQRGDLVRIKAPATSSDPRPSAFPLRVMAVGNDKLRLDGAIVFVNDVPVTGLSDHFASVARHPDRIPQTIPEGHYFVMGQQRVNQDISEYWGVHPGSSLEAVR
jgi:signal peptidase I